MYDIGDRVVFARDCDCARSGSIVQVMKREELEEQKYVIIARGHAHIVLESQILGEYVPHWRDWTCY